MVGSHEINTSSPKAKANLDGILTSNRVQLKEPKKETINTLKTHES